MYQPYPASGQPAERRRAPVQPQGHTGLGVTVLNYGVTGLFAASWLAGAAAVWLLWRPASSEFFKPQGFTQAVPGAQLSSRIRSSKAWSPRQL